MITETKTNTITRKGVQSEGKFQIKATGKAFRILSDGLYSDKIKAIIRELSCNAYDAHVDAGNTDTPFIVHIPNRLEPHFKIRDFGVGLSHNDVINVYTTYFESTKTESNDYIGCLGLGSKSPFSYVDTFSIVSYLNGEKRIYNAFLNEDETPTIALLNESKTDEPNGVEVSFPVQVNDVNRFEEKARTVFSYFKMRPKFTGAKVDVETVEYMLEGSNWGVRKTKYAGQARAVMGNVAYRLDDFSGDMNEIDKAVVSLIRQVPIDVIFNIGDLEVAASRENLSYNKRTIANINKVLGEVVKEIRAKASEKIKGCTSLWDARVLAHEIKTGEYAHLKVVLEGQDVFSWKGQVLDGNSYMKLSDDLIKVQKVEVSCFAPKTSWRRRRHSNGDPTISREETHTIHSTKGTRIFWADINRGSHLRCKQVILESPDKPNTNSYGHSEKEINKVYLVTGSKATIEALRKEIGIDSIPAISTIQQVKSSKVYNQADYNPKNATKVLVYERDEKHHSYSSASTYWRKEKVSMDEGGIYVPITRYKIDGHATPSEYIEEMEMCMQMIGEDLKNIQIVGVKDSKLSEVQIHKGWKTLRQYVTDSVAEYVKSNDLAHKMNIAHQLQQFESGKTYLQRSILDMNIDKTKPCGIFIERVRAIQASVSNKDELVKLQRIANKFQIELKDDKKLVDINQEWEEVLKVYPLFDELDGWGISDKIKEVEEYINALDIVKN